MEIFELRDGKKVQVDVKEAKGGGYSISHSDGASPDSVTVTCSCGSKGSVTKTCPTATYTCDCTGSSPVLTCG